MSTLRVEIFTLSGTGGLSLSERIAQAEAYADPVFGQDVALGETWVAVWTNATKQEALCVLRAGTVNHEGRMAATVPTLLAPSFPIEISRRRKVLLRPGLTLYVKTDG